MPSLSKILTSNIKQCIALLLCTAVLTGCGFQLKKASVIPAELSNLSVTADDSNSALFRQLKKHLSYAKVQLDPQYHQANVAELVLHQDRLDRRTLSLFKNGQVAEYELTYHVSYTLMRPQQSVIEKSFELYRTYQDDPNNALAKAKEFDLILTEMRAQASQRIIRELSQL